MANLARVKTQLKLDEGLRLEPYRCTAGALTIGYGTNIEHISEREADWLLTERAQTVVDELGSTFAWYGGLNAAQRDSLALMAYQLGVPGVKRFKRMATAIANGDPPESVCREMVDSKWDQQTPKRVDVCVEWWFEGAGLSRWDARAFCKAIREALGRE